MQQRVRFSLRKIIPDKVRIPAFVLIIATFVTVVQMVLKNLCRICTIRWEYFCRLLSSTALFSPARSPLRVTTRWAIRRLTVCLWDSALPPRSRLWARSGKFSATAPFRHKAVGFSNSVFQLGGGSLSYLRAVYPNIQRDLQRRKQQGEAQARLA